MERNIKKIGFLNFVILLLAGGISIILARYCHSLSGQVAAVFFGIGAFVALVSFFQSGLEEKERLVRLLNEYIDGPGLTIVIGVEHSSPDLRPFSLIASTAVDGNATRTVGVIGPTRMHYSRAIALVDGTTQAVSRVLREAN